LVASVLLAFEPVPVAGVMGAAGAGGGVALAAARVGGFGMYSGPGWPQPDSSASIVN